MKLVYSAKWLMGLLVLLILIFIFSFYIGLKTEEVVEKNYTVEEVVETEEIIADEQAEIPVIEESEEVVEVLNEVTIAINDLKFYPQKITISPGTTVTWFNNDTLPHKVVAYDRLFYGPRLSSGEKYSFTFTQEGTHRYFDAVFPKIGRGTIIVKEEPLPITGGVIGVDLNREESNAKFALFVLLFVIMIFGLGHSMYNHYKI